MMPWEKDFPVWVAPTLSPLLLHEVLALRRKEKQVLPKNLRPPNSNEMLAVAMATAEENLSPISLKT